MSECARGARSCARSERADVVEVAEALLPPRAARRRGSSPRSRVVARAHVEVERQLIVDVGGDVGSEEPEVAAPARVHRALRYESAGAACEHARDGAGVAQPHAASARRCARPAAVMV